MTMIRPMLASLMAAALLLPCAACGQSAPASEVPPAHPSGAQPAVRARITILTPTSGQTLSTRVVHVKVSLAVTSSPGAASQTSPGWVHLYLDGKIMTIQPVPSDHTTLEQPLRNIRQGRHELRAEFVQPNHLPWRPPVVATVAFIVGQP